MVVLETTILPEVIMLKVSKKLSTTLSLALAVFFFLCCVAGLFVLPTLTEMLINLPDNIGNRANITQLGRTLSLVSAYCSHDIQHEACDVDHSGHPSTEDRYYCEHSAYKACEVDHQRLVQMMPDERIVLVAHEICGEEADPCDVSDNCCQI